MFDLKDKPGIWLRGNLHTHTTVSDGKKSPAEAIRIYKDAGYDFLALTDHWTYSEGGDFEGMTLIRGIEYDTGKTSGKEGVRIADVCNGVYHVVALGMENAPRLKKGEAKDIQQIIDTVNSLGGIAVLAHPAWSLNTPEQIAALHGLSAVEIYNTVSGEPKNIRANSEETLDIATMKYNVQLPYVAADDTHFYSGEQCKSYIMVKAADRSEKEIIAAIKRGDFYATQGPEIYNMTFDGKVLHLEFSDIVGLNIFTNDYGISQVANPRGVNQIDFKVKESYRYIRFRLTDEKGRHAWTATVAVNA